MYKQIALVKLYLGVFVILATAAAETTVLTPCKSQVRRPSDQPLEMKGAGICSGDFKTVLTVPSAGLLLVHHSLDPMANYGVGKGFSLNIEKYFEKIEDSKAKLVWGDGSSMEFFYDASKSAWYPKRSAESNHWLVENDHALIERTPQKTETHYESFTTPNRFYVTRVTDIKGASLLYNRHPSGLIKEFVYRNGDKDIFAYDSKSRLNRITDRGGFKYDISYNSTDQLTTLKSPDNSQITLSYKGDLISTLTNPLGQKTTLEYFSGGILKSITDEYKKVTQYTYKSDHVKVVSLLIEYQENFDSSGRLSSKKNNGMVESWTLDPQGRYENYTDSLGRKTNYQYDGESFFLQKQTNPDGSSVDYKYNSDGSISEVTLTINGIPITTKYEYNEMLLTTKTEINGKKEIRTYDSFGNLSALLSMTGEQISMRYDSKGRLITLNDAFGYQTQYNYDSNKGWLTSIKLPDGKSIFYNYDKLGRVINEKDDEGLSQTYTYRSAFEPSKTTLSFNSGKTKEELSKETKILSNGGASVTVNWTLGGKTLLDETSTFDLHDRLVERRR